MNKNLDLFPVHEDVKNICENLEKLSSHFNNIGVIIPVLSLANDMLIKQSVEISKFRKKENKGSRKIRDKRRKEFKPGIEWVRHSDLHYSRDLLGDRLDYWPGTLRFRWRGETRQGSVDDFIENALKENC